MLRLTNLELKNLLRSWPPLLIAFLASAAYVVGEATRPFNGWAPLGRISGIWVAMWFYLAYFPTVLSLGWFRNDAARELIWVRRAGTVRLLGARFIALAAVALLIWAANVLLAFVAAQIAHRPETQHAWSLLKMALFSLPALGFGLALLLLLAALFQRRELAYALALFYFLLLALATTPTHSAYLLPHFFPSDQLVSEFVGFGSFATVMYLQKGYVLALTLAAWLLAVSATGLRRRVREPAATLAALAALGGALILGAALLGQPPIAVWQEKLREEWTALAANVGSGAIPPEAAFYRGIYRDPALPGGFVAFAKPANCQLAFVSRYVTALGLFSERARVNAAAEVPYRKNSGVYSGVLLVPERYRFRKRPWCERSALREAAGLILPAPDRRALQRSIDARSPSDMKKLLAEKERIETLRLLAQWYAAYALLGRARLEEELRHWERALKGAIPFRELSALGAIGSRVSISPDALKQALHLWRTLGAEGVRDYVLEQLRRERKRA